MPRYAAVFMVFTMANVGLPGTSGFVGEFLTLLGHSLSLLCPVALPPRGVWQTGEVLALLDA
jgi:NADH:ubiquinone oxidoreductase subunit 4 (subunit M)